MKRKSIFSAVFIWTILCVLPLSAYSSELEPIKLPAPRTDGGKPLMQALKERKSVREFSSTELPLNVLSDMLWAAAGINRPDSGGLTAPTAKNMKEIDTYVVMAKGAYLYDAKSNSLIPVVSGDIRAATGSQPFVKDAPVNLVFVADLAKMAGMPQQAIDFYTATDTGFISENVYLFCASEGLVTVVRGWVDKPALSVAMKLRPEQRIILAQTVGYPARDRAR